jgi:predicted Zn-dependent protease
MKVTLLFIGTILLAGCATAPLTGRSQIKLVSDRALIAQSLTSYREVINEETLSTNVAQTAIVKEVGSRISRAVEQYLQQEQLLYLVDGFQWEFNLIESDIPNAWCMPGGKVAFYTGILPFTQDEAGLAVVMGHEIAHAVVGHSAERVSHAMLQQGGGMLLSSMRRGHENYAVIQQVYGIGSQLGVILPFSRTHELEADKLGLIFMALAGYDPAASIDFWKRMAANDASKPPEFLSTHPADETRIEQIRAYLPEAMHYYRP